MMTMATNRLAEYSDRMRSLVGQVVNLRRVVNPPGGRASTRRGGRLTIGRRMPSCPTNFAMFIRVHSWQEPFSAFLRERT
jgi:hypothetical protein